MTSPADPPPAVNLALLHNLLELDEDTPAHELVRAARAVSWSLPPLVLSIMEREGLPLGAGSRDELRRCRARAACYEEVLAAVGSEVAVRVVKGPSLARRYPPGVLRPVGDIDLRVTSEPDLWRAIRLIVDRWPVEHIDVSVLGTARHVFTRIEWASDDPPLEPNRSVEVQTAAYGGDRGHAGVHERLPADDAMADLLALAEERFQRPFHAKDVVDTIALSGTGVLREGSLPEVSSSYRLAPEVVELLALTRTHHRLPVAADVDRELAAAAVRETARRGKQAPAQELETDVDSRLAAGLPVYGMLLRRVRWRPDLPASRMHRYAGGQLLLTPAADYLLVGAPLVDPERYDAALAELARLPLAA